MMLLRGAEVEPVLQKLVDVSADLAAVFASLPCCSGR